MTPAEAIADLDAELRDSGQTVTLRRGGANGNARAFVRGYRLEELVGGIVQGDREAVLSPTGLPVPFNSAPPKRGDVVVIDGRAVSVESAELVRMDDVLVRLNLQVRG